MTFGKGELVADRLPGLLDGPVWCPDGTLVCVSVTHGLVIRVWPDCGDAKVIARVSGGANGAALATDGSIIVAQNGGVDLSGHPLHPDAREHFPAPSWTRPGVQRVWPDGAVNYLSRERLGFPNDLCVAADGTVFVADDKGGPSPTAEVAPDYTPLDAVPLVPPPGRIVAVYTDGRCEVVARDLYLPNGIAVDIDGASLLVTDTLGREDSKSSFKGRGPQLVRLRDFGRGEREVIADVAGGQGMCLDAKGRYYVAAGLTAVQILNRDGTTVAMLEADGACIASNCCFGGDDLRTLFVTDARQGRIYAWENMPIPGLPLSLWPAHGRRPRPELRGLG